MKSYLRLSAVLLLCLTGFARPIQADAIVMTRAMTASTIAEIFIEESVVRVELEIGLQDLPGFRNLLPDELYERLGNGPLPLARRLSLLFREDLVVRADGGPPLPGRLVSVEARPRVPRDEITGEPLVVAEDETELVIFAVLEVPLSRRPAVLSFRPPRSPDGIPSATIGFVTYHGGLPVNDFRYLGTEETVDLDWSDPWFSRFRNRNLWRQYDAPLNVFLYVEPFEVRVEIIARPLDVQHWTDLGLEGAPTIPAETQADLRRKVAEFFSAHFELAIDGQIAQPKLDRVHFLNRTLRTSTVIDPARDLDLVSATLGAIFVHPTAGYPQQVDLAWDLFSPRIQRIPVAATDEAGPLPGIIVPDDNVLTWQNFLKNPNVSKLVNVEPPPSALLRPVSWAGWGTAVILAVLLTRGAIGLRRGQAPRSRVVLTGVLLLLVVAGSTLAGRSARIDDDKAGEIVSTLLHNVYRAFDFRDEGAIYDSLDRSVTGELLRQTYLETRRGLELAGQGGARAKVKEMEMIEVRPERLRNDPGFRALCTWNVSGSVGHWGHVHQRINQYQAQVTVQPNEGVWKITGLELLQEERL